MEKVGKNIGLDQSSQKPEVYDFEDAWARDPTTKIKHWGPRCIRISDEANSKPIIGIVSRRTGEFFPLDNPPYVSGIDSLF